MKLSPDSPVRVTVINDSRGEQCEGGCGLDWSSAETVRLAAVRIKERFGSGVRLEVVDLSQQADARAEELKRGLLQKDLSPPVLLIDGDVRISGRFDIRQLIDTIDAEMEMGHGR